MEEFMNKLDSRVFKAKTNGEKELWFYGDIVANWLEAWDVDDQYPSAVREFLSSCNGSDLNIYINSNGGDVFAGMAIMRQLARYSGRKVVHIDGIAASIASVIAMAGDEIVMPSNAMLMIHRAWCATMGNAEDIGRTKEALEKIDNDILKVYTARLKNEKDAPEIYRLMQEETYMTAEEVEAFFKGITVAAPLKIAARADNAKNYLAIVGEAEKINLLKLEGDVYCG